MRLLKQFGFFAASTSLVLSFHGAAFSAQRIVGVFRAKGVAPYDAAVERFTKTLTASGLSFRIVDAEEPSDPLPELIFSLGSKATESALRKYPQAPIVCTMVVDPEKNGFARPNIAGVGVDIPPRTQFEFLKKIVPSVKKVGVLHDPVRRGLADRGREAARELGLELVALEVRSLDEVYDSIRTLGQKVDAIWMIPDSTVYTAKSTEDLLLYALRSNIPVVGLSPSYTKAGALFSVSADFDEVAKQAGDIAVQVLNGADVSSFGIQPPRKVRLSVNLITAGRIGVQVPAAVLREAQDVYE